MAVGFGFSVGDLVTSLKVIKDSIEAVKDTKGASADYAALIAEISSLQDAFETVGDLQLLHNASGKPQLAMDRAIGACQKCVEDFLLSIAKYQPHLRYHARGLTSSYRKIKWALCKKEDVALFRAKLERHTSSINMILIAFQAKQMIDSNGQPDGSASMTRAPSETQNQQTVDMLTHLSVEQRQCFQILMQQNRELMQNVHNLHRLLEMQMSIPPQVQLQQPVILLDAFGKIAPFHLDFIDSLETFTAVLKIRFRRAGVQEAGLSKLDNREFTIQESCDKRMLDLKKPWSSIFQPGQKVDMSMVFHRFACPPTTCPGCSRNNGDGFGQTQCEECGLCYQNIKAVKKPLGNANQASLDRFSIPSPRGTAYQYVIQHPGMKPETGIFSPTDNEDDFFNGFRRVQVISQPLSLFQTNGISARHFEAFRSFCQLFELCSEGDLPYLAEMKEMQDRIWDYSLQSYKTPQFSSFYRMKKWQKQRADELSLLTRDVDQLFKTICDDEDSVKLARYISDNKPLTLDFYSTRLVNAFDQENVTTKLSPGAETNSGKTTSPRKPKSKDHVQWMLLDRSGR